MSNKAHICHITTVHPANDIRIFHKECRSLQAEGYRVTLIVANGRSEVVNGVEIIGVPVHYKGRFSRMRKAGKAVLRKALEVDAAVYHFHDPEFLRFVGPLLANGKKVVYDIHEDVPRQIMAKTWIPKLLRGIVSRRFERFENKTAKKLSALVCATPHIAERFRAVNLNTVNVGNYPKLEEWPAPDFRAEKSDVAVYIGGLTRIRGIKEMVDAVAKQPYQLELAGAFGSEELQIECEAQAGWQNVTYHGTLDRKDIVKLLAQSRVGFVTLYPSPNHLDALPTKMFEYMAAGIPVIASDFPLWREIVEDSKCGMMVNPQNVEEIRSALTYMMDHKQEALEMGKNGRRAIEMKYNWEHEAKKLMQLYAQLTA